MFLLFISLKRSKQMFIPSPLTDTESEVAHVVGLYFRKTFNLVRVLVNLSYSMYQNRGKHLLLLYVDNTFRHTLL